MSPQVGGGTVISIYMRDRRRCHICGNAVALAEASRDHLEARSLGGYDKAKNYRLAHRSCNVARGRRPIEVVYAVIEAYRTEHGRNPHQQHAAQLIRAIPEFVR